LSNNGKDENKSVMIRIRRKNRDQLRKLCELDKRMNLIDELDFIIENELRLRLMETEKKPYR